MYATDLQIRVFSFRFGIENVLDFAVVASVYSLVLRTFEFYKVLNFLFFMLQMVDI